MNKKLYMAISREIDDIAELKQRIAAEYDSKTKEEKRSVKEETQKQINELNLKQNELLVAKKGVSKAVKAFRAATTEEEKFDAEMALDVANAKLYEVADKYHIAYSLNDEVSAMANKGKTSTKTPENRSEEKNNHSFRNALLGFLAGLTVFGAGLGITSCNNRTNTLEQEVTEETQNGKTKNNPFGLKTKLTDAKDEKQVMARAQEIYNLYINSADITEEEKTELSVERLANIIRMCNGEFAQEDGEVRYSRGENDVTSFQELGNWINSYSNSTSYEKFKNNLRFKPMSVFFEEDTTAYKIALKADELVKNIYDDIKANNVAKFEKDAKAWGNFVKYTVVQNNFDPSYISLWSVESEQMYPLLKTITTTFAPSTLEYAINVGLANENETYGICIPYCLENGQMTEKPVSLMIYDINNTPMNSLAERVGKYDEWASTNLPIMDQVGYTAKSWFDSKYDREVGYQRKLK